jgi:hypothetical protein
MYNVICISLTPFNNCGLCNQLYSLVGSILQAYKHKKNIIIIDKFLTEVHTNNYIPISNVLDLEKTNLFLKKFNITIIDSNNIDFKIQKIMFGTEYNMLDITNEIMDKYFKDNILYIDKNINLLSIKGDPCEFVEKKLYIHFELNGYNYCHIYDEANEEITCDVSLNFQDLCFEYVSGTYWRSKDNYLQYNHILKHIVFNDNYISKANEFINNCVTNNDKINVIHLRVEDDAICHWANKNDLDCKIFQTILTYKYINLIKKYIDVNDKTFVLCGNDNNDVIEFLLNNGYNFY